jgi:hypothetical protein
MLELIDHGVTGFLVDNVDAAVDAIGRIGEIDRAACRAVVSARFTVDRMANRYWSCTDRSLAETFSTLIGRASDARSGTVHRSHRTPPIMARVVRYPLNVLNSALVCRC